MGIRNAISHHRTGNETMETLINLLLAFVLGGPTNTTQT
jgi:hypothetical protein